MISMERDGKITEILWELQERAEAAGIKNIIIILNDDAWEGVTHISSRAVGWERIVLCMNALDSALYHAGYLNPGIQKEWRDTFGNIKKEIDRLVIQHRAESGKKEWDYAERKG
nr:MAG TPA: hypothetical protein [Caudoviricetes sp.]